MKKITLKTTTLTALLLSTALLVSGCMPSSMPEPMPPQETRLKHSFGADHIKIAIANAAKEQNWKVEQTASNENSLLLKKTFAKKETDKNARGRTWNKVNVSQEILINVAISDKSYVIGLSPESGKFFSNFHAQEELNKELHKLQNSVSVELVHEIL